MLMVLPPLVLAAKEELHLERVFVSVGGYGWLSGRDNSRFGKLTVKRSAGQGRCSFRCFVVDWRARYTEHTAWDGGGCGGGGDGTDTTTTT